MKRKDVKLWVGRSVTVAGPSVTGGWSAEGLVVSEGPDCVVVSAGPYGLSRVEHDGGYGVDSTHVTHVDGEEVTE